MKFISILVLTIYANAVFAGGVTGVLKVGELKVGENGLRIAASNGLWADADQCSGSNTSNIVYLHDTTPSFKEIYSAVLAYKIADKPINFYVSGCITVGGYTYPRVKVTYL